MKQINFWTGVVVAIALLLESIYGIYAYVQGQQRLTQQKSFMQNSSAFSNNSGNSTTGSNAPSGGFSGQRQFGNNSRSGGQGFRSQMGGRSFQTSPYGLVINIITLILAAATLIMTAIIGKNNSRKKAEKVNIDKTSN